MTSKGESDLQRRLPIGAEPVPGGGTHFRVWAPKSGFVNVQFGSGEPGPNALEVELANEKNGYFSGHISQVGTGDFYRYRLESGLFPDPASRFQPAGPHGPSQVVNPSEFRWTDQGWAGINPRNRVIYELHIGTFTAAGTWAGAEQELSELARLGITVLEVMPVAEFPGRFGWGYDGVDLFAPTRLYGQPDDFRKFVDRAHAFGLGVILDVVYNHLGPDGNYLKHFSGDYFSARYSNEWGEAINFDGERCSSVREFVCANAVYWIDEFHLDGLRLDATQQMFDSSREHIVAALTRRARQAAGTKPAFIVAENEPQDIRLVRSSEIGGYGLDALWNDDFHHASMVALSGRAEAYYSDYAGRPQEFISTAKWGFLYQGQRSGWQENPRGTPSLGVPPDRFVNFLQNHDQVANSLLGLRAHQLTSPGRLRALTALLLLGPATPMLFQGQEFAASAPFLYFADHESELSRFVAAGRNTFLSQFTAIANAESQPHLAPPHSEQSFQRSKLDLSERVKNAAIWELHRDLLRLRREDPVFSEPRAGGVDGAVLGPEAFVLRFFGKTSSDRLLLVNLGPDLLLAPISEPLLANVEGCVWVLRWSSESPRYGGSGTPSRETEGGWLLPGHSSIVFDAEASTAANQQPDTHGQAGSTN